MHTKPVLLFIAGAAALLAACQGNRFLVGDFGAAGASMSSGAAGAATSSGAGGAIAPKTPLKISSDQAAMRVAGILWQDGSASTAAAATQGVPLKTNQDLVPVIYAMLGDPRAEAGVRAFYRWWLELDDVAKLIKDPTLFPDLTPELQHDIALEPETFGNNVTLQKKGTWDDLLIARYSYLTARLADLYGLSGPTGTDFVETPFVTNERAGLLTQPALQVLGSFASRNSPSHRGAYVLDRFLCSAPPQPPPVGHADNGALDTRPPGVTLRAALQQETEQSASCTACHALFDPYGLAFESYDAIGRFRTTDNGALVDTSRLIMMNLIAGGFPITVDGPVGLADTFQKSEPGRRCFAKQWLAFATGQTAGTVSDDDVAPVYAAFSAAGFDLRTLIVAALTSDAFLRPLP